MTVEDPIVEEVEITGHIIDSLILPKVLDTITANGGKFRITNIVIGQARHDPSNAVVEVRAPNDERMQHILAQIAEATQAKSYEGTPQNIVGVFKDISTFF